MTDMVSSVELNPQLPKIGDMVTIAINFDREMDQTEAPEVVYGARLPNDAHQVIGLWISPLRWEGSFVFSDVQLGDIYLVSISRARDLTGEVMDDHTDTKLMMDPVDQTITAGTRRSKAFFSLSEIRMVTDGSKPKNIKKIVDIPITIEGQRIVTALGRHKSYKRSC